MTTREMFRIMLEKQDRLNTEINPKWMSERTQSDFHTAIFTEVAEFIESTDWKWWKDKETDVFNAKLELVDIFHFILSYLLLERNKDVNYEFVGRYPSVDDLAELLDIAYGKATPDSNYVETIKLITAEFYTSQEEPELDFLYLEYPLIRFFSVVEYFFDTAEEFFKYYLIKLALNFYRSFNEYKEGKYKKVIEGREDNEIFFEKVADFNLDEIDINNIEAELINRFMIGFFF